MDNERVCSAIHVPASRWDDPAEPDPGPNEQEFITAMLKSWEEGKAEARAEGRAEGLAEARAETQVEERTTILLTVLRVRGIEVPAGARERILAEKDLDRLQRWFEKAIVASTIGDVFDDPR
jgi:hypothetical protein